MNLVACPELPTASVVRRKRRPPPWTTLQLQTRPESTYKSGKVVQTNGATSLAGIVTALANDHPLTEKHRDHALTGDWKDHRDCHIKPNLVLIYQKPGDAVLRLVRMGSHSELGL